MKKSAVLLMAIAIMSCSQNNDKEIEQAKTIQHLEDSIRTILGSGGNCGTLQQEVDRLNKEVSDLKRGARNSSNTESEKSSETATHKKKAPEPETAAPASSNKTTKTEKPVVRDQDRNASTRCKFSDKNGRCKKRTFSSNGYCWQHGGNQ